MNNEDGRALANSDGSIDHVVVSTPSIEVDELLANLSDCPPTTRAMNSTIRPSSIVRQWFGDIKRRASEIIISPPTTDTAGGSAPDDDFLLVLSSGSELIDSDVLADSDQLDVSMMVNINSDPLVEIMLENRIVKLETDLQACEIEYEQTIDNLKREIKQQTMNYDSKTRVYEQSMKVYEIERTTLQRDVHRIPELEARILCLQKDNSCINKELKDSATSREKDELRIKELEAQVLAFQRQNNEVETNPLEKLPSQMSSLQKESDLRHELNCSKQETCHVVKRQKDPSMLMGISKLSSDQIERYSRQLLLQDGFGVKGQGKLLSSSVLVVGAGGIGSTLLLYLAASGVGKISVMDFDKVDRSNLHRQVIHQDTNTGLNKAVSACQAMKALNPTIDCTPIEDVITFENAYQIISRHDCVVDASDNPRTRYLINDACVLSGKPLVSGSAMGTEGQLTVYDQKSGPCYRCLYPKPNTKEGCKTCSDNGVLGPVPGLIGVLQATEVLKVLTGIGSIMSDRLLMYDALRCSFTSIKKPAKSKKCIVCSDSSSIKTMDDSKTVTTGVRGPTGIVGGGKRVSLYVPPTIAKELEISCTEYNELRNKGDHHHVLLDVRVERQFDMCNLENAVNIPLADLENELGQVEQLSGGVKSVYCICRRGIFSIAATKVISKAMAEGRCKMIHSVKNVSGGLEAWSKEVDSSFPKY